MAKNFAITLILVSMVLHSASRLGVISYVFDHRHDIAFSLGLISEKPIATCSTDYSPPSSLEIVTPEESGSSLPPLVVSANEILLFFDDRKMISLHSLSGTDIVRSTEVIETTYHTPVLSIFHPPAVS